MTGTYAGQFVMGGFLNLKVGGALGGSPRPGSPGACRCTSQRDGRRSDRAPPTLPQPLSLHPCRNPRPVLRRIDSCASPARLPTFLLVWA